MTNEIDNGGPAFPQTQTLTEKDFVSGLDVGEGGMNLRDYFAAKAMQGMYACGDVAKGCKAMPSMSDEQHCTATAQWAYLQADCMLKARKS